MTDNDSELLRRLDAKVRMLEEEAQQLRVEVGLLRSTSYGSGVDLVILDDIVLYTPTNDNLYSNFMPPQNKNYNIAAHGLPKVVVDDLEHDSGKALYNYTRLVAQDCGAVDLFDIGSWAGDVAIRLGRYAKLAGLDYRAHCYDPSFAGSLVPFNTHLNDVRDIVDFVPAGISLEGGPLLFNQVRGHSDSSGLSTMESFGRAVDAYVINTYTLQQILSRHEREAHKIIKIDVEGLDALIVKQNFDLLSDCTIILEFNPGQRQYVDINPWKFLEEMAYTHSLYDLFYAPKPTRVEKVENYHAFIMDVAQRPHRYTDILMVPQRQAFHDRFDAASRLYSRKPDHSVFAEPFRTA